MTTLTPVCIDLETFWSQTHSLSKMNPIVYCTHPETELISIAYKFADDRARSFAGEQDIKEWCKSVDWSDKLVYGHNLSGFDAMILRWRLGIRPAMWGCTLAMARPHHVITVGGSLAKLVEHYKLGVKDQSALLNTKGRHLKDFTPAEVAAMLEYNKTDVEQCAGLFKRLLPKTPKAEMKAIDMTVRMLVEPKFRVDTKLLRDTLAAEQQRKQRALLDLARELGLYPKYNLPMDAGADEDARLTTINALTGGVDAVVEDVRAQLASAQKFAVFLGSRGVEPPTKPSPTNPDKMTFALAKSDEAFLALREHDDPLVAAAVNARLDVKSTILESRIEAFLEVARATGGRMPIAKNYYGAHTGRFSGAFGLNQENLPRVSGKPSDALRNSLVAPPGHKVVVADLSGIELRVNHFLWKVPSSMALFQADPEKADLYKDFASKLYGVPVEDVTKAQRQVGKVAHLGLGYGAGAGTFKGVAKIMGGVDITAAESLDIVTRWRSAYAEIAAGWKTCHRALDAIAMGAGAEVDPWGLVTTDAEGFILPSGRKIRYPGLRKEMNSDNREEWVYGEGRHKTRIYAGKVTENCIAGGTLVLTSNGWKPIESVSADDLVHDGVGFVHHDGVVCKQVQPCVKVDGVYMTPDHEVLTDEGWKEASQIPRPYRPDVRLAEIRVAPALDNDPTLSDKQVYDIVNAGPRQRFVVLGTKGPFIVHNCVQAIARDILLGNAFAIKKRTGLYPVHTVHDELIYIVPEADAEQHLATVQEAMRTPPTWWPELVVWSEGDVADSYGDAK